MNDTNTFRDNGAFKAEQLFTLAWEEPEKLPMKERTVFS